MFNHVSNERFSDAKTSLALLRADITQYYVSRDITMETIATQLNRLQTRLDANYGNVTLKQQLIYKKLREVIRSLATCEKEPGDKYEHLLQIYGDIQGDLEQFVKSKRYEDAEAIRDDFTEIRNLDADFQTDKAEYKLYQEVMRQIGLCTGTIVRLAYEKRSGSEAKKMYSTFENLFPKIESLIASKKFREEPKEEQDLSDTKIKEIRDLSKDQNMNAEQIASQSGIPQNDVESILFGEEENED